MLEEPEALWSRVLRSKYCEGRCDVEMFKPMYDSSNAWRGITNNFDVLKKGIGMVVGNGCATNFWKHPWATSKPLISLVNSPPPTGSVHLLVKDVWDSNTGWKSELFADYLPPNILQVIASFELQDDPEAIDKILWNGEAAGGFSIKSYL